MIRLLFMACVISANCWAYQLSGIITDENNDPIPYASIYINKSTNGVSSNLKGEYYFELENGTYDIVFSSVGFEKTIINIVILNANKKLNVRLKPEILQLKEIKVSGKDKDPAYAVIKQAIKYKEKYKTPVKQYTVNAYIKSSLEKEKKIRSEIPDSIKTVLDSLSKEKMNFVESYSTVYFKAPNHIKEIKTAVKDYSEKHESSFEVSIQMDGSDEDVRQTNFVNPNLFKNNITDVDVNFYQNNIEVPSLGPAPYVSPISSFALLSYNYILEDYFYEDGFWINKIQVKPKRTDAALFSGYIYIVNDLWCIKGIDLVVDPATVYLFDYFRIIQGYSNIQDSIWMLANEEFFYNSKEGKKTILGNTYIKYSDYNLVPNIHSNFFNNELMAIVDDAYEQSTSFWEKVRPLTLKNEEQTFINVQDSIDTYHKSDSYLREQDSIINKQDWQNYLFGFQWQNSLKKWTLGVDGLLTSTNPFGVGGYRHGVGGSLKKEWKKAYKITTNGKVHYGFNNQDIKGKIEVSFMYLPKRFGRLHASYRDEYDFVNSYEAISTTFSMSNYINFIGYTIGHEMEIINGLYLDAGIDYAKKVSIEDMQMSLWTEQLFGEQNTPIAFEGYEQFILDLELKFTPFQKYYTEPYKKVIVGSKYPTLSINYRKGINGIFNSIADFDFVEVHLWDDFKLGRFGKSKWHIYTGKFFNNNSILFTEDKFFRGSDPYFFSDPLKSFQLLGASLHTSNEYFQTNYLHRFNGVLLNKVPLVKKLHLQEVVGVGILLINDNNFRHGEMYGGVEKMFMLGRQLFKIGAYYVVADSNYSEITSQIKFGIDFYDTFTNSWSY